MSGSEQAKAKEDAAAIMRAKQLAGTSSSSTMTLHGLFQSQLLR